MSTISKSFLLVLMLLGSTGAWAFNFSPIEATFRPSGVGSTHTFTVENPGTRTIAVELTLFAREMNLDGSDRLEPADGLFEIYPAQMIIEPGSRQAVRVQWTGPADIESERPFRLIAEQLAIDLGDSDSEGGALNLLVRYVAALYVQPANVAARIELQLLELDSKLVIEAANRGQAHAIVSAGDFACACRDRLRSTGAAGIVR
jgi:fimbrial chaperone protein